MYAHSPDRNWEADINLPEGTEGCKDIARQLFDSFETGKIKLAFGGGRRAFPNISNGGIRQTEDLIEKFAKQVVEYLETMGDLQKWNYSEKVLGLFGNTHMDYEVDRDAGPGGQPSLTEMT